MRCYVSETEGTWRSWNNSDFPSPKDPRHVTRLGRWCWASRPKSSHSAYQACGFRSVDGTVFCAGLKGNQQENTKIHLGLFP